MHSTNPRAARWIVALMALYLHLGPWGRDSNRDQRSEAPPAQVISRGSGIVLGTRPVEASIMTNLRSCHVELAYIESTPAPQGPLRAYPGESTGA
jgi:hypothetical protein